LPYNKGTLDAYRKIITRELGVATGSGTHSGSAWISGSLVVTGDIQGGTFTGPIASSPHASSHYSGSTDAIGIDASQITSGSLPLSAYPTGSMSIDATQVVSGEFTSTNRFSSALLTDIRDHSPLAHGGGHTSGSGDTVTIYKNQISDIGDLNFVAPQLSITGSDISSISGSLIVTGSISGSTFLGTNVNVTYVTATNVSGSTISGSSYIGSSINVTDITAVHITGSTHVSGSTIYGKDAIFTNLTATNVTGSTILSGASIYGKDATIINVNATNITGSIVSGSTFYGKDVSVTNIIATFITGSTQVSGSLVRATNVIANTITGSTVSGSTGIFDSLTFGYVTGSTMSGSTIYGGSVSAINIIGTYITGSTQISGSLYKGPLINSFAKSGSTVYTGNVILKEGTNVTITEYAVTGGRGYEIIASGDTGSGGTPSDTVVVETGSNLSSAVGTASVFSRGDHTHGAPYLDREAIYIIWSGSDGYYALSGLSGQIDYSGSNATTVISGAIGNLTSGRTWKEKIILKGNFSLPAAVNLTDYMILDMQGAKLVLQNSIDDNMIYGSGSDYVEIIGGYMDGNKAGQTTLGDAIRLLDCSNIIIKDVNIVNPFLQGIRFGGTDYSQIISCYISGANTEGIMLDQHSCYNTLLMNNCISNSGSGIIVYTTCNYNHIGNNWSIGNALKGISLALADDNIICNNYCYNNTQAGINIDEGSERNSIINNHVLENELNGINVTNAGGESPYNVVEDNYCYNNTGSGIYIDQNNTAVLDNVCVKNGQHGIDIYDAAACSYVTVQGNSLINNGQLQLGSWTQIGIKLNAGFYCTVTNNTCLDNQAVSTQIQGIAEYETSDYNLIKDNIISGSATAIAILGANTKVYFNDGYVTESNGTSTITAGLTSSAVSHSLALNPTSVVVTPMADTRWWVSNTGSSTFQINIPVALASDLNCMWRAEV